jgi:hypothetical protein
VSFSEIGNDTLNQAELNILDMQMSKVPIISGYLKKQITP